MCFPPKAEIWTPYYTIDSLNLMSLLSLLPATYLKRQGDAESHGIIAYSVQTNHHKSCYPGGYFKVTFSRAIIGANLGRQGISNWTARCHSFQYPLAP